MIFEGKTSGSPPVLAYIVNSSRYFLSHRLAIATAAKKLGFHIVVVCPDDGCTNQILAQGFDYIDWKLSRRGFWPWNELFSMWSLLRICSRIKPALVHCITVKPILYYGIIPRISSRVAVVYALPGLGHIFSSKGWLARVRKWMVMVTYRHVFRKKNATIIFQNLGDKEYFSEKRVGIPHRMHLIRGSGVDPLKYVPGSVKIGVPIVLFPGRLLWSKGIGEFVAVARSFKKMGSKIRFAIVGKPDPGNASSVSDAQVESWVEEGAIENWGWHSDMVDVYHKATIVCYPSKYGEGVPRALIEAASCGVPIVATDSMGVREIVKHGKNGFLANPGDCSQIKYYIDTILSNPNLEKKFGLYGRKLVIDYFSEELVVNQTTNVYINSLRSIRMQQQLRLRVGLN